MNENIVKNQFYKDIVRFYKYNYLFILIEVWDSSASGPNYIVFAKVIIRQKKPPLARNLRVNVSVIFYGHLSVYK